MVADAPPRAAITSRDGSAAVWAQPNERQCLASRRFSTGGAATSCSVACMQTVNAFADCWIRPGQPDFEASPICGESRRSSKSQDGLILSKVLLCVSASLREEGEHIPSRLSGPRELGRLSTAIDGCEVGDDVLTT